MAVPDVGREWKFPEPDGDDWSFDFPFTIGSVEALGMYAYLTRVFESYEEGSLAPFVTENVKLTAVEGPSDQPMYHISMMTWLAPYDLGISQKVSLSAAPAENEKDLYAVWVDIHRESGDVASWQRHQPALPERAAQTIPGLAHPPPGSQERIRGDREGSDQKDARSGTARMKFAFCNEMFRDVPLRRIFRTAAEIGYDGVEIAPFTVAPSVNQVGPDARKAIRDDAAEFGLEITGLHWLLLSPEGLYLNHPDDGIRYCTRLYLCDLIKFCGDIGAGSWWPGRRSSATCYRTRPTRRPGNGPVRHTWECLPAAEEHGVTICLEPLDSAQTNFINTPDEAARMVREIDHPNFRMIIDVRATLCQGLDAAAAIHEHKDDMAYVHFNDASGNGPGFGDTDFAPILQALRDTSYDGYGSVEVFDYSYGAEHIARKSLETLKTAWAATDVAGEHAAGPDQGKAEEGAATDVAGEHATGPIRARRKRGRPVETTGPRQGRHRPAVSRIARQILERNKGASGIVIVGIQRRGDWIARRLAGAIREAEDTAVPVGVLDINLYRDDLQVRADYPVVVPRTSLSTSKGKPSSWSTTSSTPAEPSGRRWTN